LGYNVRRSFQASRLLRMSILTVLHILRIAPVHAYSTFCHCLHSRPVQKGCVYQNAFPAKLLNVFPAQADSI